MVPLGKWYTIVFRYDYGWRWGVMGWLSSNEYDWWWWWWWWLRHISIQYNINVVTKFWSMSWHWSLYPCAMGLGTIVVIPTDWAMLSGTTRYKCERNTATRRRTGICEYYHAGGDAGTICDTNDYNYNRNRITNTINPDGLFTAEFLFHG